MTIMEKYASPTAYSTGVFTALFGSMTLSDIALVVGIATTFGTFVINWYYKAKDDKRRDRRWTDRK